MSDTPPTTWQGWRRRAGSFSGPWEKVPGAEGPTRGLIYDELMLRTELAVGMNGNWQYQILPAGQEPPRSQTYRHRTLRPQNP